MRDLFIMCVILYAFAAWAHGDVKDACAQEGCCCLLEDGSTCCTYDLNCLGCPCAL